MLLEVVTALFIAELVIRAEYFAWLCGMVGALR
jgi:hypothetical protein